MARAVICLGDPTSHGGKVLEGDPNATIDGRPIALRGHMTLCPQCKGKFPITEGLDHHSFGGIGTALEGMKTACGATLIATQHLMTADEQSEHESADVYDVDLGEDNAQAEKERAFSSSEQHPPTSATPGIARMNSSWAGAEGKNSGPVSKAPHALFKERQYEAVYEKGIFIGVRNSLDTSQSISDDATRIQLNTLDSIRHLIAEQKMNAILEVPTSYGAKSFSPE
ncbi:PAAR domain-containing protein [Pseudoduganella violacea]|uniref:Putative Zn-binding protein involved in type VI secretion n=1 Tax=Pseudoduganella violacea TaxID=1715466 RepID=A0A7W5BBD4_9BURK|nr:putative Zn-binding protein involved in type VI secretion [Pseudoduganella violacea]